VGRFLGLDYGDKTIGVAVSCPLGKVAVGVETIRRTDPLAMKPSVERLRVLVAAYDVTHIVLGYPKHMDGTPSARCEKTTAFAERLKRNFKRLTIDFWDERLSTQAVKSHSNHIDEMAAVYILQGYLDFKNTKTQRENKMDEQILMLDEDGNEQPFDILASKEKDGIVYLLAVETSNDEDEEEDLIVHFKCIATEGDDMVFELIDEDHEEFESVMELFEADYEALDIIIEE
jgi:putative Holliday junction resolvase